MNSNGNEFSWSSYTLRVDATEITDIKGVKYAEEVEGADPVYGASRVPRGRTAGRYKPGDASVTFYRSGWVAFLATAGTNYGSKRFTLIHQWVEGSDVHTAKLEDCRILGSDHSAEEGTDASEVEVKFSFLRCIQDGTELVAS
jgi:hypothetical protein